MWIDSHCHLDFKSVPGRSFEDPGPVIERALEAGVTRLVNVGCDLESSREGLMLAQQHEFIFCTLGVHPNDASKWSPEVEKAFEECLKADRGVRRIVGIGEVGLDFFRKHTTREVQEDVFRAQLRLAVRFELPVVVHCRDAYEETLVILDEENVGRVAFHCYSGSLTFARKLWERGWHTSFTAVVSYPQNHELREVVRSAPEGQYFLETDAPFLPHQSLRGERNEPAYLPRLGETVADIRGETISKIAAQTSANAVAFFGLGGLGGI